MDPQQILVVFLTLKWPFECCCDVMKLITQLPWQRNIVFIAGAVLRVTVLFGRYSWPM